MPPQPPTADTRADARAGPDRRSVVRTAAWALPVVAVSAQVPAYAASCNQLYPGTFDPSTQLTKSSPTSATAVVPLANGGGSVTITFSAQATSGYSVVATNFDVNSPIGNTGLPGLHLGYSNSDTVTGPSQRYILTMSFSRTVTGLDFLVTDIDKVGNHDEQLVVVQPTTFTRQLPCRVEPRGSGDVGEPDPQPRRGRDQVGHRRPGQRPAPLRPGDRGQAVALGRQRRRRRLPQLDHQDVVLRAGRRLPVSR